MTAAASQAKHLKLAAEHDPHIVAWAEMDEAAKRAHLGYSHGHVPESMGGWHPFEDDDDPDGTDAWVLKGDRTAEELDELHEADHADDSGGGGRRWHVHPGVFAPGATHNQVAKATDETRRPA